MRNKSKKKTQFSVQRVILATGAAVAISVVLFVVWFIWAIFNDPPPQFFPINNKEGEYRITRGCLQGQGELETPATAEGPYCVEYKGQGVFNLGNEKPINYFRVMVGRSDVDLASYLNKRVHISKGKFVGSSKQCIRGECTDISGPWVVLDVYALAPIE